MKARKTTRYKFIILIMLGIFAFTTYPNLSALAAEQPGTGENLKNAVSNWQGASKASDRDHTTSCTNIGALLSSFHNQPCSIVNMYPTYNTDKPGGTKLTSELDKWWVDEALPTLRQLTAQISGFIYTQTQILAITFDAVSFNDYARIRQQEEYKTRKRYSPNEYSCVAASNISALAKARTVSEQLTESLKTEMEKRANGLDDTTGSENINKDFKSRWDDYCQYFKDPESNGGISACNDPDEEGIVKNADIDIEGFLFKDTIDMSSKAARTAVRDLFINLHQSEITNKQKINSNGYITDIEIALKREHTAALRNSAAHVIASIIARRAPVHYETISGVTSGDLIKAIRKNAGVPAGAGTEDDPNEVSPNPSYNELMLALTKERFLDPTYYIRVQGSIPAIQREQASVEGYVNMQLNDIYQMQEQINTLIAAKASINAEKTANKSSNIKSMATSRE